MKWIGSFRVFNLNDLGLIFLKNLNFMGSCFSRSLSDFGKTFFGIILVESDNHKAS